MKKNYAFGGLGIMILCLLFTACPDSYAGQYYDVTWGSCLREEMDPIWQNPELSYADTRKALTACSDSSVHTRVGLKERGLLNCLDDDVRLTDAMVQQMMETLSSRPDATQSYYRSTEPDICYWVYVVKK